MHDRIIVGVARRLNVGILTIDKNIVVSGLVKTYLVAHEKTRNCWKLEDV